MPSKDPGTYNLVHGASIQLSGGYRAIVDAEDHFRASYFTWSHHQHDGMHYAHTTDLDGKSLSLHRFIMDARPGQMIDHINGDGLDCRKSNMRFCTTAQNSQNRRASRNHKHGQYKGVTCRKSGRWLARIGNGYKSIYLGDFPDAESAARAYDAAALTHFGEFARLNFPLESLHE